MFFFHSVYSPLFSSLILVVAGPVRAFDPLEGYASHGTEIESSGVKVCAEYRECCDLLAIRPSSSSGNDERIYR